MVEINPILLIMSGFIVGLLLALFTLLVLTYFRSSIEKRITIIEKKIQEAGPKPKGFVITPVDEAEEARQEIIERNKKVGKVTRMEELI